MQRSTAKRRVAAAAPEAAILLKPARGGTGRGGGGGRGARGGEGRTRSGFALLAFMRATAAVWIAQGLLQWAAVLTTGPDGLSPFSVLAPAAMAAAVFFAVVDFVAAIGLWLAAPWGGVIWLVAAGGQILVLVVMPGFFEHPLLIGLSDVALMAAYLALVWFAAQGDAEG